MIRKTYLRKVEARLAGLEEDIERLRSRMSAPAGEIRDKIEREILYLRRKAETVARKVRAVEESGATGWGRLKSAVDDGLKDLERAIDETIEKFRKTGS